MTHTYIKASSNQRSTTSREASATGRLRPNGVTADLAGQLTGFATSQALGRGTVGLESNSFYESMS